MKGDEQLKNTVRRPSSPEIFLALSFWLADTISYSPVGSQLQAYGYMSESAISGITGGISCLNLSSKNSLHRG